jgi:hypothetical protein
MATVKNTVTKKAAAKSSDTKAAGATPAETEERIKELSRQGVKKRQDKIVAEAVKVRIEFDQQKKDDEEYQNSSRDRLYHNLADLYEFMLRNLNDNSTYICALLEERKIPFSPSGIMTDPQLPIVKLVFGKWGKNKKWSFNKSAITYASALRLLYQNEISTEDAYDYIKEFVYPMDAEDKDVKKTGFTAMVEQDRYERGVVEQRNREHRKSTDLVRDYFKDQAGLGEISSPGGAADGLKEGAFLTLLGRVGPKGDIVLDAVLDTDEDRLKPAIKSQMAKAKDWREVGNNRKKSNVIKFDEITIKRLLEKKAS